MKTAVIFLLVSLSFLLAGCANPNIGKPVDRYLPFSLSGSGHETVHFGNEYILDYSYHLNNKDKIIFITGKINCKIGTRNWNYSEGSITVKFVSKEGTISEEHTLTSWWDEQLCTEKFFQSTYPFQDDFDGVTFFFKVEMHE